MLPVTTEQIADRLRALRSPFASRVRRWVVRVGRDSTDDPAVWVHPVLEDADADAAVGADRADWKQLRAEVQDAVAELVGPEVFTYVRLQLVSENVAAPPA